MAQTDRHTFRRTWQLLDQLGRVKSEICHQKTVEVETFNQLQCIKRFVFQCKLLLLGQFLNIISDILPFILKPINTSVLKINRLSIMDITKPKIKFFSFSSFAFALKCLCNKFIAPLMTDPPFGKCAPFKIYLFSYYRRVL